MVEVQRQVIIHYVVAAAIVMVVTLLKRFVIAPLVGDQQWFLLYVAAICASSWYGGFGPGIVTAILSALAAAVVFAPARHTLDASSVFQLLMFLLEGLLVAGFTGNLRETRIATQKSEQAKDEALALLDTFQVNAPVGLAFLDNDMRYQRINYAMAELDGLTPAAHIGRTLQEVQPQIKPELIAAIKQAIVTGQPLLDQEVTLTRSTLLGLKKQSMLTSYYRIRGQDGTPIGIGAVMVDVTAHKQAEDALRESELRFRSMADTAPVMIRVADTDMWASYVNKVWLDFTGRTLEQELGDGWRASVHPDDAAQLAQVLAKASANREGYSTEYRLRRRDGEYRWILSHGVPRYTPEGGYVGFIGTGTDITERKQQENIQQFVLQSGELLASSLDYTTTLNSVARLAVPTIADWCAVDLLSPGGAIERVAVAHIDPEKVKWAYEIQKRFPTTLDASNGVGRVLRTGETEFVADVPTLLAPIFDSLSDEMKQVMDALQATSVITTPLKARGAIIGALTFATAESRRHYTEADIATAELLAMRAALAVDNARLYTEAQAERERFRITLTSIGDAVIATNQTGAVTFINRMAQNLTGWPESDALGQPLGSIFNIVNEQSREPVENPVDKVLREGRVVGLANHTVLVSRTGAEIPVDDSGAPIPDETGATGGVVLVFRDVTERNRNEQRQVFLTEASKQLISSLNFEATLQRVTELAVPALSDWCAVYLAESDDEITQVALSHNDPDGLRIREALMQRYPLPLSRDYGYPKVIRTGQSELLELVSDDILRAAASNEEHLELLRASQYQSSICVPLKNIQRTFGAFTLNTKRGGRTLNADDLALAEELARIASLAIENARLYRAARNVSNSD